MAKDWNLVKADICRYYSQGKSLREVRNVLRAEKNFDASVRAYRLKLSEWRAKRPRKFCKDHLSSRPQQLPPLGEVSDRVVVSLISDDEEDSSLTRSRRASPAVNPVARATSQSHGRSGLSCTCLCVREKVEEQCHLLRTSFPPHTTVFEQGTSNLESWLCDGRDNLLHCATRDQAFPRELYARMLDHVRFIKNNIDARDCDRMTALEIAVRRSDHATVKILLRAGASHTLCSVPEKTLVKTSMLDAPSYDVANALLSVATGNGSMTHTRWYWTVRAEVLDIACEGLRSEKQSWKPIDIYRLVLQILNFDSGLHKEYRIPATTLDLTFEVLVETWECTALSLSLAEKETAIACCKELLAAGASIVLQSDRCSSKHPLRSRDAYLPWRGSDACCILADLVLFHQDDGLLASAIIDHHAERHSEELVRHILSPCRYRTATVDGDQLAMWIRRMVTRSSLETLDLLILALRTTPDPLKYLFVQTILDHGSGDLFSRSRETDTWEAIAAMCQLDETLRWSIADLVLQKDPGVWSLNHAAVYHFHSSTTASATTYLNYICHNARDYCDQENMYTPSLSEAVPQFPLPQGGFRWQQGDAQRIATELKRCVIHVLSKAMLDNESRLGIELPRRLRIRRALELRRDAHLPDVAIDTSLLINVLS